MYTNFLGTYRAIVTNNSDPTGRGFIKVQCPQVAGLAELNAAEPADKDAPVPNVGDLVWVYFNGGETHKPIYSIATNPLTWNTSVNYGSGWASNNQFDGLGGPSLRFRKTLDDCVYLYGNFKITSGTSNFPFILPAGYYNPTGPGMSATAARNSAGTLSIVSFAIDVSTGTAIILPVPVTGDEFQLNVRIPLLFKP